MSCKQAVKPPLPLRGNCNAAVIRYVYQASAISLLIMPIYYFLHMRDRRQKYKNFYKHYDAEAAFTRMIKKGDYFTHLEPCP